MEAFFTKYNVSLDEWNGIDKIVKTANKIPKIYDPKDESKYLKKLACLHEMIHDFFESKGENIEEYYPRTT